MSHAQRVLPPHRRMDPASLRPKVWKSLEKGRSYCSTSHHIIVDVLNKLGLSTDGQVMDVVAVVSHFAKAVEPVAKAMVAKAVEPMTHGGLGLFAVPTKNAAMENLEVLLAQKIGEVEKLTRKVVEIERLLAQKTTEVDQLSKKQMVDPDKDKVQELQGELCGLSHKVDHIVEFLISNGYQPAQ